MDDQLIRAALKRAFLLGQTYWQQADSEYQSQWKKADVTQAQFRNLVEETCAAIEAAVLAKLQAQSEPVNWNWVDLQNRADEIVRGKVLWKRFIDGTPLANDIACWMADFAQEVAAAPVQQEPVQITDSMAYAFQRANTDGSLTHDEVDEIKRGLKAAFADIAAPVQQDVNQMLLEALKEVWLWMENQADAQSKGGHATFDLMMLREHRDIARAAIAAVEGKK